MNGLRISRPPDTSAPASAAANTGSGATFVSVGTSDFARWFAPLLPLLPGWRWVLHAEPHVYRFPDAWYGADEVDGARATPELRRMDALVLDERDDWKLVEGAWLQAIAGSLLDDWADFFALREPADDLEGFLERYWAADTPDAAHALLQEAVALHFSCLDGAVWEVHAADPALLAAVRAHVATLPGATAADSSLMQSLRRYEAHG
ncbi:MAG TPA: hypothetical protein VFJ16_06300 [Longimicrobium sp.]|nr:hypothetical protein [Longimicrobium sp.]